MPCVPPYDVIGWSVICDSNISWSYSLFIKCFEKHALFILFIYSLGFKDVFTFALSFNWNDSLNNKCALNIHTTFCPLVLSSFGHHK